MNHSSEAQPRTDGYYIFVKSTTVNGRKIYASHYGKKAFRIWVKSR